MESAKGGELIMEALDLVESELSEEAAFIAMNKVGTPYLSPIS